VRRKDKPDPPSAATSTEERLAAIVEAAERAAVTVIDDAEAQARRRLEQAQAEADRLVAERLGSLADLTDSLVAQAEAIRAQSERLIFALQEAKRQLGSAEVGGPAAPARPSHLSAVEPVGEPLEPAATESRSHQGEGSAAGARLLATQMAVSGSSREEIEIRLRNGFEIEDTASILDAILGPEE
jgi:cell division septum initiation protein DivIVA